SGRKASSSRSCIRRWPVARWQYSSRCNAACCASRSRGYRRWYAPEEPMSLKLNGPRSIVSPMRRRLRSARSPRRWGCEMRRRLYDERPSRDAKRIGASVMARVRVFLVLALAVTAGGVFAFGTYNYVNKMPKQTGSVAIRPVVVAAADLDVGAEITRDDIRVV